ncbi:MAG: filamentous hemagglutinin N-terminal domain-containing protein, partial [Gammaproteobacteria bacterium]|nr:filamentous hemagglutinin N-terminal domain-containing protein [Gammaproteobacteria bacterium]
MPDKLKKLVAITILTSVFVQNAIAELPQVCNAGGCGANGPSTWVTAGTASKVINGQNLTINQLSDKAILNWQSFNVGKDNAVLFNQPNSSAIALNKIYQGTPSEIMGKLSANGQIYLVNQNGILFGNGAQINTAGLVATTLDIDDELFKNINLVQAIAGDKAYFERSAEDGAMGDINIAEQAVIQTTDGGRVLMIAPTVENNGKIKTPNGQTVLVGSDYGQTDQSNAKTYVFASLDPELRGLRVEVANGGKVKNTGEIVAEHGNITLLGFAVNQDGILSATTSLDANGSIRLIAEEGAEIGQDTVNDVKIALADSTQRQKKSGDTTSSDELLNELDNYEYSLVSFGENSVTEVIPDIADKSTAVDEQDVAP